MPAEIMVPSEIGPDLREALPSGAQSSFCALQQAPMSGQGDRQEPCGRGLSRNINDEWRMWSPPWEE